MTAAVQPGFRAVLVTGASSGIGAALALAYAAPGVRLVLTGRDTARLRSVEARCAGQGASVRAVVLDVTDRAGMREALEALDDEVPFDLVVANAGIGESRETEDLLRRTVQVNVEGVLNTVSPLLSRLAARRRGQVALMSSLGAFRGLGGPPGYHASKAWVRLYGEVLRVRMAKHGVGVTVVCPGFVDTPMTRGNRFRMPYLWSADRAAATIKRRLARNPPRISFPWQLAVLVWLAAVLPAAWTDRATS